MPNAAVRRREHPSTATSAVALSSEELSSPKVRLQVTDVPISEPGPPSPKDRRYNKRQHTALKASIDKFGLIRPILVDAAGSIIAGVAVWMAAKELGFETVPTLRIEHLTPNRCASTALPTTS